MGGGEREERRGREIEKLGGGGMGGEEEVEMERDGKRRRWR